VTLAKRMQDFGGGAATYFLKKAARDIKFVHHQIPTVLYIVMYIIINLYYNVALYKPMNSSVVPTANKGCVG